MAVPQAHSRRAYALHPKFVRVGFEVDPLGGGRALGD